MPQRADTWLVMDGSMVSPKRDLPISGAPISSNRERPKARRLLLLLCRSLRPAASTLLLLLWCSKVRRGRLLLLLSCNSLAWLYPAGACG